MVGIHGVALTSRLRRRTLYALAESRHLHALVRTSRPVERRVYRRAEHYLGGRTLQQALDTLRRLHAEGFATGVDFFGEARADLAVVEAATRQYVALNRELARLHAGVNVWIDLTNVGLDISEDVCRRQLARIVETLPADARLQVRAHDSTRIDRILTLAGELAGQDIAVMPTLQANLRRSPEYAQRLTELGVPVLLVKGAHLERADVAHPWGEETDVAFVRLAHQLHAAGTELAIATHDPVVRESLLAALPDVSVEMLLGVRTHDAHELAGRGVPVRVYVPFGEEWPRYWLRRRGEAHGA